jgi:hypothetical protein
MYQSTHLLILHIYSAVNPSPSTQFLGQILLPQGKNLPPCFTERADQCTVQGINVMISRWRAWEASAAIEMLTRFFLYCVILLFDVMLCLVTLHLTKSLNMIRRLTLSHRITSHYISALIHHHPCILTIKSK